MKRTAAALLLLTVLAATRATAEDPPAWRAKAEELVKPLLDTKLRNLVVGVIDAEGRRHYLTFGAKPGGLERLDENTIFEIGSITKVFTSLALADAVTRDEVKLDDPVQKYLPASMTLPKRGGEQITLEELATHTSGLPRMPANFMGGKGFDFNNPFAAYDEALLAAGLKAVNLKDEKPKVAYSNLGAGLLGYALSKRFGKSYEDLLQERVLRPLNLASTSTAVRPEDRKRLIPCHTAGNQPGKNWDFLDTTAGAGALRSTAADVLTFLEHQTGRRDSGLGNAIKLTHEPRREFRDMSLGLGWLTFEAGESKRRVWWHNGGTGGYCSFAAFCKDPAVGIIILSNRSVPQETDKIGMELIKLLAEGK